MGRCINLRELKRQCELKGVEETRKHLKEALDQGHLSAHDFSLHETATAFMGQEWVASLNPKSGRRPVLSLRESAADAVAFSAFSNITGQIAFTEIMQAFDLPEFVFSKAIPTVPSAFLDQEKIPGISQIGDEFTIVEENDDYPKVGPSEDWTEVGAKKKRGAIVPVTREAILGDRTGQLLDRCRALGKWLGLNREKRLIDVVIDENAGATSIVSGGHRFHWRGTSYATYQATTPWSNIVTSNPLTSWTSFDLAWQKFIGMTDPWTGEPINIMPTTLIVTPQNYHAALQVLRATQVRRDTNNAAGTANTTTIGNTPVANTFGGTYAILTSALLAARAATDTDWWLADPAAAWAYYSIWDIETQEAPADTHEAFHRDLIFQFKASEMGTAATKQPRGSLENQA